MNRPRRPCRGDQIETSRAERNGQTLVIATTARVTDRAIARPFNVEVTRKLSLESPSTMIVEVTRSGVLGGSLDDEYAIAVSEDP